MNNGFVRWLLDLDRIPAEAEALRLSWERPFEGWVWLLLMAGAALFAIWSYSRIAGNRRGRGVLAGRAPEGFPEVRDVLHNPALLRASRLQATHGALARIHLGFRGWWCRWIQNWHRIFCKC